MLDNEIRTTTQKITVSVPSDVLALMDQYVLPRQRSSFIVEAIREHLDRIIDLEVFEETAGAWTEENHPDMRTPEDIDRWLTELRQSWTIEQGK